MRSPFIAGAVFLLVALPILREEAGPKTGDLKNPVKLEAGGRAIDVEIGHAAPFAGDFDGDGLQDLLVGQFGGGKLRIYRNVGTKAEPRFEDFEWFQAGGATGAVPAG